MKKKSKNTPNNTKKHDKEKRRKKKLAGKKQFVNQGHMVNRDTGVFVSKKVARETTPLPQPEELQIPELPGVRYG